MKGQQIGRYLFEEKLGEGGMAEVWKARNVALGTYCAIKFLSPTLSSNEDIEQRFLSEGRRQATLNHPNIVSAQDFIYLENRSYLVMRYIDGESLDHHLFKLQAPMATSAALAISNDVLSALGFAHQAGVIHRDVKPSNILIEKGGRAYVLDFGIALALGEQRLTRVGVAVGTPHYMSPEQIVGSRHIDQRSDIYSFGCVLYQMMTERPPFDVADGEGDTDYLVKDKHLRQEAVPPRELNPDIPPHIERAIMRCLEKDAAKRFASCRAVAEAISDRSSLHTPPPIPAWRPGNGTMIEPLHPTHDPNVLEPAGRTGMLQPRFVGAAPLTPPPIIPTSVATPVPPRQPFVAPPIPMPAPPGRQKSSSALIWVIVGLAVAAILGAGYFALEHQKAKPIEQAKVIEPTAHNVTPPVNPEPRPPANSLPAENRPQEENSNNLRPPVTPPVNPTPPVKPRLTPDVNPPLNPTPPDKPPVDPVVLPSPQPPNGQEDNPNPLPHNNPTPVPRPPSPPPSIPEYHGPTSGDLVWSGEVRKNDTIEISNGNSSAGSVSGSPFPGVPISVSINSNKFSVSGQPNPLNHFSRIVLHSSTKGQQVVTIHWSVLPQ